MAAAPPVEAAPPRRNTTRWAAVGVAVALALFVLLLATRSPSGTRLAESPLLGRPAPVLEGTSVLDGAEFDLADLSGRFVLVNFFATWCAPCIEEHDDLVRFAGTHAEADDARVVSVVFDDEADDVADFFERRGGDWPVLADEGGRATVDFGVTGVPESFLVGPEGAVRARITGGVDADRLEDLLRRAEAGDLE